MSNSTSHRISTTDLSEDEEFRIETLRDKAWRRIKENPAVPVGFAAVIFSFYMASRKMRERKSLEMNYWLRARVITQGFTILAISWSAGAWERLLPATAKERPGLLGPLPASSVGILEGEEAQKAQFEGRMRRAEEAHKAEEAVDIKSAPKKIVISSKKAGKAQATEESHDLSGGYWRWLRWGSGSPQEEKAAELTPTVPSLPSPQRPPIPSENSKPSGSWLRWVTGISSSGSGSDKKP